MGYVKYKIKDGVSVFDIEQNLMDNWGINYSQLPGLKLVDRKNPKHFAIIQNTFYNLGILCIKWKEGGWNCLDHAIEQFKIATNE